MSRKVSRRLQAVGTVLTALALAFGFASPANADPGEWDPTLPKILSAGAPGDPVACDLFPRLETHNPQRGHIIHTQAHIQLTRHDSPSNSINCLK